MRDHATPILAPRNTTATETVIELLGEDADVAVRRVDRGGVRVAVHTATRDEDIALALTERRVDVERIIIGREVAAVPPIREEGDVTIISVVEEVAVTQIRLILKEEIHLRRTTRTRAHHETVTLREQHVEIDRITHDQV